MQKHTAVTDCSSPRSWAQTYAGSKASVSPYLGSFLCFTLTFWSNHLSRFVVFMYNYLWGRTEGYLYRCDQDYLVNKTVFTLSAWHILTVLTWNLLLICFTSKIVPHLILLPDIYCLLNKLANECWQCGNCVSCHLVRDCIRRHLTWEMCKELWFKSLNKVWNRGPWGLEPPEPIKKNTHLMNKYQIQIKFQLST